MAYEVQYKRRILKYLEEGHTQKETAEHFGVGATTIKEWRRREAAGEPLSPKTRSRQPKKLPPEELRQYVEAHPDAYLSEIAEHFGCTAEAVRKALKKQKITRKKRRSPIKSKMNNAAKNFGKPSIL